MAQTVIGIFKSAEDAQRAVDQLLNNGFSESDVDLSSKQSVTANSNSDWNDPDPDNRDEGNDATLSDNDRLREPDSNPRHESGIARFFRNLFGNGIESDRYTKVAEHGCVVTVHARNELEANRASDLLDENGAVDVDEHYKQYSNSDYDQGRDYSRDNEPGAWVTEPQRETGNVDSVMNREESDSNVGFPKRNPGRITNDETGPNTNTRGTDIGNFPNHEGRTIPIIEENLRVDKREIETGGVRIRSRIVEKPVEETLRLREEKIRVERHPVDRDALPSDIDNFEEGTIEMRERAEVPEVSKEARVVEEISLDRDVEHRDETIHDSVRHTEVDVENLEDRSRIS